MTKDHVFSVSEFAKFARTTADALRHYENIGLVLPISRNHNNHRQYDYSQLAVLNLIHTCQSLGMSLPEIKELQEYRTPGTVCDLMEAQIKYIDENLTTWQKSKKLLSTLSKTIRAVKNIDESAIAIQWVPKQPIVLGEQNDYGNGRDDYSALDDFYQHCYQKYPNMDFNYPVWGLFSEERIKKRDWHWPDRYYFIDPDGQDERPGSYYAIGYKRGGYGQSAELYERILEYIDKQGFVISGPTYEEYPLNEICVTDENNYLMRVMITVERIKQRESQN